jgi:hypothetical protein
MRKSLLGKLGFVSLVLLVAVGLPLAAPPTGEGATGCRTLHCYNGYHYCTYGSGAECRVVCVTNVISGC